MYRAHLNYQIMGPWHEWVMVKFILENKNISDLKKLNTQQQPPYLDNDEYPLKVLCFFKAERQPEINAIVQSCEARNHGHDSILFQQWRKECTSNVLTHFEPLLCAVPVDSFGQHVLVVEDDP